MIALLLSFCAGVEAQWNPLNAVKEMQKQADGMLLKMERGTLRIVSSRPSGYVTTYVMSCSRRCPCGYARWSVTSS